MGNGPVQALAALQDARLLRTLSLDLSWNSVRDNGAEALVALKELPLLHTLSLDLGGNSVGDRFLLLHPPALPAINPPPLPLSC